MGIILLSVGLVACGHNHSSEHSNTSSNITSSKHKDSKYNRKTATKTSKEIANQPSLEKQLSTSEWYMLAYLQQHQFTLNEADKLKNLMDQSNNDISTGSGGSVSRLISVTESSVQISSPVGVIAEAHFRATTSSKNSLMKQYIHNSADVQHLQRIVARAQSLDSSEKTTSSNNSSKSSSTDTSTTENTHYRQDANTAPTRENTNGRYRYDGVDQEEVSSSASTATSRVSSSAVNDENAATTSSTDTLNSSQP